MMSKYECFIHLYSSEDTPCIYCGELMAPGKAFQSWTAKGTRFLAIPHDGNFWIIDENSQNYGVWMSVDKFKSQFAFAVDMPESLGEASVSVQPKQPLMP